MSLIQFPRQFLTDVNGTPLVGAKAYVYQAGTSTLIEIWTDASYSIELLNPVPSDSDGRFPAINIDPSVNATYKLVILDADGAIIYSNDELVTSDVTGIVDHDYIVGLLNPRTNAENTAGVTPVDLSFQPGWTQRQGIKNDSATDYTSAFQAVLNAAAGSVPVHVYKTQSSGYIKLTGRVTAPANTRIILHDGVELRWTATTATGSSILGVASRPGIEVQGNNFVLEGNGKLTGPTTGAVVTNEVGIMMKGASTSSRLNGFHISGDIEIASWGSYGTWCQFVDHAYIFTTKVHDIGYCGIQFLSCNHWWAAFNEVYTITPGITGDAYGISGSHDSSNYSADTEVLAGRQRTAANPFCIDGHIDNNTIYDVPSWRAVDFHGGFECSANFNRIYNTKYPIGMCSSSGAASAYAGENNEVIGNTITSKRVDGSATTVASLDGVAIVLNGGTTVQHYNVQCVGNTIDGYGLNSTLSHSISASNVRAAHIAHNTFANWQRNAIYSNAGDGVIEGNIFRAVANASNSRCLWIDGGTYGWSVFANRHETHGGTAAAEGLRISTGTSRPLYRNNEFSQATTPYVDVDGPALTPAQITANTNDYSPTGWTNHAYEVLRLSTDASRNLTGIAAGYDGRLLQIYNVGSFDLVLIDESTSTAANRFLLGGNVTLQANEGISLRYDGISTRWRAMGRNN